MHNPTEPWEHICEVCNLVHVPEPCCAGCSSGVTEDEMQPHYAEIAAERLKAETRGLTLQDVQRGQ